CTTLPGAAVNARHGLPPRSSTGPSSADSARTLRRAEALAAAHSASSAANAASSRRPCSGKTPPQAYNRDAITPLGTSNTKSPTRIVASECCGLGDRGRRLAAAVVHGQTQVLLVLAQQQTFRDELIEKVVERARLDAPSGGKGHQRCPALDFVAQVVNLSLETVECIRARLAGRPRIVHDELGIGAISLDQIAASVRAPRLDTLEQPGCIAFGIAAVGVGV